MVDKYGKISYVLLYAPYVFLVLAILLVLIIPNKDWAVITGLISFGLFVALIIIDKIIENNIKSK